MGFGRRIKMKKQDFLLMIEKFTEECDKQYKDGAFKRGMLMGLGLLHLEVKNDRIHIK